MAEHKQNMGNLRSANSRFHDLTLRFVKILNAIVMTIPFAFAWYVYYADKIRAPYYRRGNWVIILLFLLLYVIFGRTYEAFMVSYNRISEMVYSQMLAVIISYAIYYVIFWLLAGELMPVWPLLLAILQSLFLSIAWSIFTHRWYFKTFKPRRTAIIWDEREGLDQLVDSYGLDKKFEVVKTVPVNECLEDLSVLKGIQAVFFAGIHSHDRNVIIKYCVEHKITSFIIPRVGDVLMSGARQMHMFHLPMLRLERYNPSPEYLFVKRLFDIVASLAALIILSPLMIVVALLIRKDGGPAFYKQCRLTKDGKKFDVLKFRSMRTDAEKDGVARLSTGENDDRITPIGKIIRKVRIDELPQLINILKGDMSIVGPRPERPEIAAQYEETLPEFRLRLQAKCGLTGYAQVYGKYNTTPYDKLQMDLMYISNPSLAQDLSIIFATIKILFLPESTEGVAEGQTTAMGTDDKSAKL
ncbi:MAG: exopolysaccharide biosynthesis polyprenyl glycosylphosphotransferase [Erysipelotrichaceae bacterium]|nr:exopolysaccharide biosynthesis polyprenyl glycosylphosphotransferase [Erysipelotrichaceae bacterium]